MTLQGGWSLLKEAYAEWSADNALRLGASLAYYTVFSIAPLLVLAIAVVGLVFGRDAAQGEVLGQMRGLVGSQVGGAVQSMVASASSPTSGAIATVTGIVTLLFGASGVFVELQDSMNTIWNVPPRPSSGFWSLAKARLLSFSMVVGVGFLLLVSLVVTTVLVGLAGYLQPMLPKPLSGWLFTGIQFVVSLAVITVLFALVFKVLPDIQVAWRDVWGGAALTALLFTIGKVLIGLYLSHSAIASSYGAAGSLILLLAWVYYSSQILFFGAELTQVYSRRYGSRRVSAARSGRADAPQSHAA